MFALQTQKELSDALSQLDFANERLEESEGQGSALVCRNVYILTYLLTYLTIIGTDTDTGNELLLARTTLGCVYMMRL